MALEDFKDVTDEQQNQNNSIGKTNVKLDSQVVSEAKKEVGVNKNKDVAPFIEACVLEEIGTQEEVEEKLEEFKSQFEEEEDE